MDPSVLWNAACPHEDRFQKSGAAHAVLSVEMARPVESGSNRKGVYNPYGKCRRKFGNLPNFQMLGERRVLSGRS